MKDQVVFVTRGAMGMGEALAILWLMSPASSFVIGQPICRWWYEHYISRSGNSGIIVVDH